MPKIIQIQVSPKVAANELLLKAYVCQLESVAEINHIEILKKSIDARQRNIKINLKLEIYIKETFVERKIELPNYKNVANKKEVVIIGAGPAGLFAALKCLEIGLKPIVLERGKNVSERRRDLAEITKNHKVNPNSNYCFGEGGAGTYSDGKLYTRSKKRGSLEKVLNVLVAHGATKEILVNAHPHIGTNKLPQIVEAMRNTIVEFGGEVNFNSEVVDLQVVNNKIDSVTLKDNSSIKCDKIILATGHSARDIYELLHKKNILIELKPFALGVRVEHQQSLIDKIQYKCEVRNEHLPPSSYNIVKQINGRGVHSFCMCPGGIIAPCATNQNEVVTNGWSPSKRNQLTANSGIVVQLEMQDFEEFKNFGALAAMEFQKSIEQKAWQMAGKSQKVPAQRLIDFVENKLSKDIPKTSYYPGTTSVKLSELFPKNIYDCLTKAFVQFGKTMKGYLTNEAIVHAPESRTSSPVRIPRDKITLQHPQIENLFPCGEGAGFAGGIISAAIDGERCATMCAV